MFGTPNIKQLQFQSQQKSCSIPIKSSEIDIDTYLHTIPITAGKVGILHDFCCVKLQNTDTTDTTSYLHIRILPF